MDEKEKKHGAEKISKIPTVFFIAATYALNFISWAGVYSAAFYELSAISRYLAWICAFILLFDFLQNWQKKRGGKKTPRSKAASKHGGRQAAFLKKAFQKIRPQAESTESPPQAEIVEHSADSGETVSPEKDALQAIPQKMRREEDGQAENKKRKPDKLRLLQIAYVTIIALLTINFIAYVLDSYSVRSIKDEMKYSLLHVGMIVVLAAVSFGMKKWFETGKDGKNNRTAVSFFGFFGTLALSSAFLLALNVMFGLKTVPVMFWVLMGGEVYLAAVIAFRLVLSVVKHNVLSDFDFVVYIPFVVKSKNQKLLTVLEESTGLSLKSLWSLKYVAGILPGAVLGTGLVLLLATCVYKVEPYEQAVVYRLGALTQESVKESGFHFKAPWPIDKADIFEVERVNSMTVGYEATDGRDYLWTQSHGGEEYSLLLGGGNELVAVNVKLMYVIDDLYAYVTRAKDAESILRARAYEIMMEKTITTNLDTFLSVDRSGLAESVKEELIVFCAESGIGLQVQEVVIESIHPPVDIADTYQSVVSAGIQKTTMISQAEASALEKKAQAEQAAKTAVIDSQAKQTEKVAAADSEMSVYRSALEAYKTSPGAFKLYKYLSTYEKIIGGNKVYVFFPKASADLSDYIINRSGNGNITVIE